MEFNVFGFKLTVRILLIIANSLLFAFFIMSIPEKKLFAIPLILVIVLIYQIWELNRHINLTNREIARFMSSLRSKDFASKFSKEETNSSFALLFDEFESSIKEFRVEKHKLEATNYYRDEIIKHLVFGLITINEDGLITLINKPALKLFDKQSINSLKELEDINPLITKDIQLLLPKGEKLIEFGTREKQRLLLSVSTIIILNKKHVIISFQDIGKEIDQKEVDAWVKLLRVIRHEIMNSITPISSMSETIALVLEDSNGNSKLANEFTNEDITDLNSSVKTIKQRTEGLYKFVEKYWDISKIPQLKIKTFKVNELIDPVYNLMLLEAKQKGIELSVEYENVNQKIEADISLIEQVLINLIKNSTEALQGSNSGRIIIKSYSEKDNNVIEIIDNGPGIPAEIIEEVFIPFYTTKAEGSGIGLSLSKQIMNIHGGSINVYSTPNVETMFRLVL